MVAMLAFGILAPAAASAHSIPFWPLGYWGPILSCTADGSALPGLPDSKQCTNLCDLMHTAQHFIYFIMSLGVFALAPILFIWGGIQILIAGASPEGIAAGRRTLIGTVIGMVIALAAFSIVSWVIGIVGAGGVISFGETISCTAPPGYTVPTFTN